MSGVLVDGGLVCAVEVDGDVLCAVLVLLGTVDGGLVLSDGGGVMVFVDGD